ncbi:superoxide dismutase [Fe], partial [Klebsiella pneumoniae]
MKTSSCQCEIKQKVIRRVAMSFELPA